MPTRSLAFALSVLVLAGCAHHPAEKRFDMAIHGPASACAFEIDGRRLSQETLPAFARRHARSAPNARIATNSSDAPWRCIAAVIYTFQMAGFTTVSLVPPTSTRAVR